MQIKINHSEITSKLAEIRQGVGGKKRPFVPRPLGEKIDVDLSGESIKTIFHDSGWLIRNNQPVFVYIRDHTIGPFSEDPHERRKVHFSVCKKLEQMEREGRFESRYRATNRVDNKYLVDIDAGWGKSKEIQEILYPCQHCLNQSGYRCFSYKNMPREKRRKVVEFFDAKEAMNFIKQHFDSWRLSEKARHSLKRDVMPVGYHPDHSKISRAYREEKGYVCEQCGVNLAGKSHLTDIHHKDGDKRNNSYDNLECLCKICHAERHPYYKIGDEIRWTIERARKQGVL